MTATHDTAPSAPGRVLFGLAGGFFLLGAAVSGASAPIYRAGLAPDQRGPDSVWIVAYACAVLGAALGIVLILARERLPMRLAVGLPVVAIALVTFPMLLSRTMTFTGAILLLWPVLYAGCLLGESIAWVTVAVSVVALVAASVVDPRRSVTAYGPMAMTLALTLWVIITLQRRVHRLVADLVRLATTDPLTGLANRRSLLDALDREIAGHRRRHSPLALLMIDADRFKQLNDSAGHHGGDEVLRRLAGVLRRESRRGDLAARFGGEEFIVVMADCSLSDAVARADDLRLLIAAESVTWPHAVTVSIGVAGLAPGEPESTAGAVLLRDADAALYSAKERGRNRVVASDR